MRRKIVLLVMMLLLCLSSVAYAGEVNVTLDGELLETKGVLVNSRVMVPLVAIAEDLGLTVKWYASQGVADIYDWQFKCGSIQGSNYKKTIRINTSGPQGKSYRDETTDLTCDVPMQVINGTLMVPLTIMVDLDESRVTWDGPTNTAVVKTLNVWVKERDEALLQAQFADGSIIDLTSGVGAHDRSEYGVPLSERGLAVRWIRAEWRDDEQEYYIKCQIGNDTGKDINGYMALYMYVFDRKTGEKLYSGREHYTDTLVINGQWTFTDGFVNFDPEKHEVDILMPLPKTK